MLVYHVTMYDKYGYVWYVYATYCYNPLQMGPYDIKNCWLHQTRTLESGELPGTSSMLSYSGTRTNTHARQRISCMERRWTRERKRHSYHKEWHFNEHNLLLENACVDQATNTYCSLEKLNEVFRAAGLREEVICQFGDNEEFADDNRWYWRRRCRSHYGSGWPS